MNLDAWVLTWFWQTKFVYSFVQLEWPHKVFASRIQWKILHNKIEKQLNAYSSVQCPCFNIWVNTHKNENMNKWMDRWTDRQIGWINGHDFNIQPQQWGELTRVMLCDRVHLRINPDWTKLRSVTSASVTETSKLLFCQHHDSWRMVATRAKEQMRK